MEKRSSAVRRSFSLLKPPGSLGQPKVKDVAGSKMKPNGQSGMNIPQPKKTSQLPRWSKSTHSNNSIEKCPYYVSLEGLWAHDFVVLPKSRKTQLARLSTFSKNLVQTLGMVLKSSPGGVGTNDQGMEDLTSLLTLSDLQQPDHAGWLVDLNPRGVGRCWCVLADMLLVVFPDKASDKASKVIMLPGLEVKAIVYKTAKQDICNNAEPIGTTSDPLRMNGSTNNNIEKTISGMLCFQILLIDPCSGDEHVLGVETQKDVDRWLTLLKVAVNLDVDVFTDSDSDSEGEAGKLTRDSQPEISTRKSNGTSNLQCLKEQSSQNKPSYIDGSGSKDKSPPAFDQSRIPRLRSSGSPPGPEAIKKKGYLPSSASYKSTIPLRAQSPDILQGGHNGNLLRKNVDSGESHIPVFSKSTRSFSNIPVGDSSQKSEPVFPPRTKSMESLLVNKSVDGPEVLSSRTKRAAHNELSAQKMSSSIDSADLRKSQAPGSPLMNLFRKTRGRAASCSASDLSNTRAAEKKSERAAHRIRTNSTSSSVSSLSSVSTVSSGKSGSGLGARLVRTASTLRVKMFGAKSQQDQEVVKLGSLREVKKSGYLSVKHMLKWSSYWCVVCNGVMYSFNTQSPSDTSELALPLRQCKVHLSTSEKSSKKYLFKISQANSRSVQFAAQDNFDLSKWVLVLRRESGCTGDDPKLGDWQLSTEMKRQSMGSQLSIDSSVSVQSNQSVLTRGSVVSQTSASSHTSSLSSLSQQSSSSMDSPTGSNRTQPVLQVEMRNGTEGSSKGSSRNSQNLTLKETEEDGDSQDDTLTNEKAPDVVSSVDHSYAKTPTRLVHQTSGQDDLSGANGHSSSQPRLPDPSVCDGSTETVDKQTENIAISNSSPKMPVNNVENQPTVLENADKHTSVVNNCASSQHEVAKSVDSQLAVINSLDSPKAVSNSLDSHRHLTRSLQNVTVSLSAKYSSASPLSTSLNQQQQWRGNDKSYQLQLLKAKISSLPDRPAIFNRHLPGPNNEGLLMLSDVASDVNNDIRSDVVCAVCPDATSEDLDLIQPSRYRRIGLTSMIDDDGAIARKPSLKVKRRFSLKRRESVKENRPNKYTIKLPDEPIIPPPKPIGSSPEPKTTAPYMGDNLLEIPPEIDSTRRRSLSDGQLPVSVQRLRDAQGQGQVKVRSAVEVAIPARDLGEVSRVGYLERKYEHDWASSWFVLKDNTLYQYGQPIDDVTQDVLQLPGYEVIPCLPSGDKHVFELVHPDYAPLVLSTDTVVDVEMWMEQVHLATQKLTLDSLNLDMTNSLEYEANKMTREQLEEEARRQWQKELLRLKKQQLLREVLQQKEELTRRQNKLGKSKQSSFDGALPSGRMDDDPLSLPLDDEMLRDRAILKQRKVSTQLKMEMVQKQMQSTLTRTKTKKKGFKLKGLRSDRSGGDLGLVAALNPDNELLETQLKELQAELDGLTAELERTERKSASSSHLSSISMGQKRHNFALSSSASTESNTSRERSHSDFSDPKGPRSFSSDPNLLHPTPAGSSMSLRLEGIFSPESPSSVFLHERGDGGMLLGGLAGESASNSRVHLLAYNRQQGSAADIPMIDDTPSPQEDFATSRQSRHSWNLGAVFPNSPELYGQSPGSNMAGLNKSCDFNALQGFSDRGQFHHSTPLHAQGPPFGVSRSKSESGNLKKCEISATALAEIAAFEELVQQKMHVPSPVQ